MKNVRTQRKRKGKAMDYKYIGNLVDLFKNGDRTAFDKLYSLLYPKQYAFASSIMKDKHLAEDAVQDSFMYAFTHIQALKNSITFVKWLSRITYCTCALCVKQERRRETMESNIDDLINDDNLDENLIVPSLEETISEEETRTNVIKAIQKMDWNTRVLLYLRYGADFKYADIAEIMGVPQNTVRSRFMYAKKKLSKKLLPFYAINPFFFLRIHYALKSFSICGFRGSALKKSISHIVMPFILTGGIATTVFFGVENLPPVIRSIDILNYSPAAVSQNIQVKAGSNSGIASVRVKESGLALDAIGGQYQFTCTENGDYTVVVTDRNGKSTEQSFQVSNIDADAPVIKDTADSGDTVTVNVSDTSAGIDWSSITVRNDSGDTPAFQTDQGAGSVIIDKSSLPVSVTVSDKAGNWSSERINYD